MIIGFKYVNEEQENKDFYIFPVGRISTNKGDFSQTSVKTS